MPGDNDSAFNEQLFTVRSPPMSLLQPFSVNIDDEQIADLKTRLAMTRFPEKETVNDWSQGVPLGYLRDIADYWHSEYDMGRLATRLNALPQFTAAIDGLDIHYIHVQSPEPGARPLILTHGWPGSVVEFLKAIGPLTNPVEHGNDPANAFHVVCPSLPGYGFSGKPAATGWGVGKIADTWSRLMATLGYESYFAQGGDWGSPITTRLARRDNRCKGIHLNMPASFPTEEQKQSLTADEREYLAEMEHFRSEGSGYSKLQGTRPQTIGYSLVDSPVGLLAWILEKFQAWMDCDGHPENTLSRDEILDNVMVYWLNGAGASAARLYWESGRDIPAGDIHTPTGITQFPGEIHHVSRRWAENTYKNIRYWNTAARGGHFAAFEQPEIFVDELRRCFRQLES